MIRVNTATIEPPIDIEADRRADRLNELRGSINELRQAVADRAWFACRIIVTQIWQDLESFDPFDDPGRCVWIINQCRTMFSSTDYQADALLVGVLETLIKEA